MKKSFSPKYFHRLRSVILLFLLFNITSCSKDWLDVKRDKTLVVPQNLDDYQALLDNTSYMNNFQTPYLGEISADDLSLSFNQWNTSSAIEHNAYIWSKDQKYSALPTGWFNAYQQVFCANIVLDGIEKSKEFKTEGNKYNNLKGSALFYRSWTFFQLAQVYCKTYQNEHATQDRGIPLRLDYDINIPIQKNNLEAVYKQILLDLKTAATLLPQKPLVKTRPSRPAVFALLAKTYLQMEDYKNSVLYADSCLQLYPELIDYKELSLSDDFPLKKLNQEVIFHSTMYATTALQNSVAQINQSLYQSYETDDLRKIAYFKTIDGRTVFKGSYDQSEYLFSGIATDEIYLIRAESALREGNKQIALNDLNKLLTMRYRKNALSQIVNIDTETLLIRILEERRKELLFRGIRWMDLKRLNKDARFKQTLKRALNNQIYELLPNDELYVLPFPSDVSQ